MSSLSNRDQIIQLENKITTLIFILENVEKVLDGEKVSDFAKSFSIVRKANGIKNIANCTKNTQEK